MVIEMFDFGQNSSFLVMWSYTFLFGFDKACQKVRKVNQKFDQNCLHYL